jgi:WASH complex subunit CCDC53
VTQPTAEIQQPPESTPNDGLIKICDSPIYNKFFKMLKFGIPPAAVKQKMGSEGLDPNLLDNPDLMVEKPADVEEEE